MTELERAFALFHELDARTAERLEPTPYGPVVVNERLHHVHDLNFLRADEPGDASAEELAAEAERVQGAVGLGHRRVNFSHIGAAEQRAAAFAALGWEPERFVLMALRRAPDRPPSVSVREVDEPTLRPLWAEATRRFPHGKNEEVVQQILEHRRLIADAISTRFFAVEADGKLVAHAELYSVDGAGQVENVVTLEEYRGRGFARALVLHGVRASQELGNDLTFLVADADDWPYRLYERLGFEIVGRYARYLRRL
jgi:ribosomal protein S18 acetylase RimI-like enzyme